MFQGFKKEHGHTLIEVLTALIILLIVIWPASAFFSKIMTTTSSNILLTATNLAEQEMERTLLEHDFVKLKKLYPDHRLRLEKEINKEDNLITIWVTVYAINNEKKLVQFQRIYLKSATDTGLR